MTVLLANPILWLFYIAAAALGILTGVKKLPAFFGLGNLAVHAAAMIAIFLAGGALEDALLFLLFSAAAALAASCFAQTRGDDR